MNAPEHDDVTAALSSARHIVRMAKFEAFDRELDRLAAMAQRHPHRREEIIRGLHDIARTHGLLSRHVAIDGLITGPR